MQNAYLQLGHVLRTAHMLILVICEDKQDIGLARRHSQPRKQERAKKRLHPVYCVPTSLAT